MASLVIEHHVGNSVILVPQEVIDNIVSSLIERPLGVGGVAFLFVGIDHPIKEGNNGVLEANPLLSVRVEVERHVVITLDVHELVVQVEQRQKQRLML